MGRRLSTLAGVCLSLVTACGPTGAPATPVSPVPSASVSGAGEFNPTDVMFAQMMVPHHGQGLDIVRLARGRAVRPEVGTLAAAIESTQVTEVQTMSQWLRTWRQPPEADPESHAAHGGLPGTSPAEIAAVAAAPDDAFERRFLQMLIAHQDDAIQLARLELAGGTNPDARAFAAQVDASRSAQITQMLAYLRP